MEIKHMVSILGGVWMPPRPLHTRIRPEVKLVVLEFDGPAPPGVSHQEKEDKQTDTMEEGGTMEEEDFK